MSNLIKILIIIAIVLLLIELSIEIYQFINLCSIFKNKFYGNKYGEYVRQIQNVECGVTPEIPIKKYLYYKKEMVGAISGDILILKGSSTILDAVKDIEVEKKNLKHIGGVQGGSRQMVDVIITQIQGYKINYITGWSLGAMIGIQIALHIYDTTGNKTKNIFFGLPPCVDKKYKEYYNSRLYDSTIVYNNDRDPLAYPFFGNNILSKTFNNKLFGYYHVGKVYSSYPYTNYYKTHFFSMASYHLSYF